MNLESLLSRLRQAILPILEAEGFELVEINFIPQGRNPILRLLVDRKEGGISLGECSRLNTKIGEMLDEQNLIQDRYILEVSSPGLDRPLKNPGDYTRCINRKASFFLSESIKGKMELQGEIKEVTETSVFVHTQDGDIEIPLAKVVKAKQAIE